MRQRFQEKICPKAFTLLLFVTFATMVSACAAFETVSDDAAPYQFPGALVNADLEPARVFRGHDDPFHWSPSPRRLAPLSSGLAQRNPKKKLKNRSHKPSRPLATPGNYDESLATSFVLDVYRANGIDLSDATNTPSEDLTPLAIYQHTCDRGALYQSSQPSIGDLVFFHNTYDRNRDGRWNDWYTLIGIVESVDKDGQISALAFVDGAVQQIHMNPRRPDLITDAAGHPVNTRLRDPSNLSRDKGGTAGRLFAGFGDLLGETSQVRVIDGWRPPKETQLSLR